MPTTEEKTRENRLRRQAKRAELELVKVSEAVLPGPSSWLLVDPASGKIVSGLLLLTIDEIETFLT